MGSKRALTLWIVVLVIIIAVVVGVVVARSGNGSSGKTSSTSDTQMNMSNSSGSTSTKPGATDKVTITNFAFSPATITVKAGTTVTWTNQDSVAHTVTADSGSGPDSGDLSQGQSYSFTYKTAGTFAYHCSIHPDMHGSVVVTD